MKTEFEISTHFSRALFSGNHLSLDGDDALRLHNWTSKIRKEFGPGYFSADDCDHWFGVCGVCHMPSSITRVKYIFRGKE